MHRCLIRKAPAGTTVALRHDGQSVLLTAAPSATAPAGLPSGRRYFLTRRGPSYDLRTTCPMAAE